MDQNAFHFNLNKSYPDFEVNVQLNLNRGEFFSLLGPSGCGKTTLLRLIAGLEENDSGSIVINGEDVSSLPPTKRKIGMVFQEYALFPHFNVAENIAYGLKAQKCSYHEIREKVRKMLILFELENLEKRSIHQLSGGEKQRVALARSLITEPHILLLDEPFSALDYGLRTKLRQDLRDYQKRLGFTTVFVTHQQEEALILSDRLGVMHNGRLVQTGTPLEIYENPASRFVAEFLGEANFIKASWDQETKTLKFPLGEGSDLAIPANPDFAYTQESIELLVRPENIMLNTSQPGAVSFPAVVTRIDYLGYMYRVETLSFNQPWVIYVQKMQDPVKIGDEVSLTIPEGAFKMISQ